MDIKTRHDCLGRLNALIRSGVPLERALDILATRQAPGAEKKALEAMAGKTREGLPLDQAMEGAGDFFAPVDIEVVRAGIESNDLPRALDTLAKNAESLYRSRLRQRAERIYYSVLLLGAILLWLGVKYLYVLPMAKMNYFRPMPTLSTIADYLSFLLLAGVIAMALLGFFAPMVQDRIKLAFRFFSLRQLLLDQVSFLRTLAMALESGISGGRAAALASASVENLALREKLSALAGRLDEGERLGDLLDEVEDLPESAGEMALAAEASGRVPEALREVADLCEEWREQCSNVPAEVVAVFFVLLAMLPAALNAVSFVFGGSMFIG